MHTATQGGTMKVYETHRTANMGETAEIYVVASTAFGHVKDVIAEFPGTADGAVAALRERDVLRNADLAAHRAGERTLEALAVRHDCDAHAVPYTSDGPLGHGWECGKCGQFLQAG